MPSSPYKAVFFDLDGTLIDSFDGIVTLFLESLDALGVNDCTPAQIRALIGIPLDQCFARFVSGDAVDQAVAFYRARYEVRMHDISPPFPGVAAMLAALREAGVVTGVISNKRAAAVRSILGRKGWPIDIIVGEGEGVASKPAPDMLWHAARAVEIAHHEALYVGDSRLDAQAAAAAAFDFAGVTTGEMRAADFAAYPNVGVFADHPALQAFLLPEAAGL
jgi:phosphoglycolate phosphatase